jgi:hypothetical protein
MKANAFLNIPMVAFLILAVMPGSVSANAPAENTPPNKIYLPLVENAPKPILGSLGSIQYTLDTSRKVSATYNSSSGPVHLKVTDAKGYVWELWVYAGVAESEVISMTPFASLDDSQSQAKPRSGVQLEPDGLQFSQAVSLIVTPPMSNPGAGLIFSLNQDGSGVRFAETWNSGNQATAYIWHFSAAAYDDGADAGTDLMSQYAKWAAEDYKLALDAANLFIKAGPIPPPTPPAISQFCRGTEVNPNEGEAYEFMRYFLDPYLDIVTVILGSMKTLELVNGDADISAGMATAAQIMQMADTSILKLGTTYQNEKPPDHLFAIYNAGLQTEYILMLMSSPGSISINPKLVAWSATIRDYYLDQLKTKHDYRAFPILLDLEKQTDLLGGSNRLQEIMSAMTFEVDVDTSFDATWYFGSSYYDAGHVEQTAKVKNLQIQITDGGIFWGDFNNAILKYTKGSLTVVSVVQSGTYALAPGQTYTVSLLLQNWDACVTKTFDVKIFPDFGGVETYTGTNRDDPVAGAAGNSSFPDYYLGGFLFSVPMQNLNPTLGDHTFSGTSSTDTLSTAAQIHLVITHTPQ